jgi:hypothetical protein
LIKIDIKILRWILLGLYIAIILGLLGMIYTGHLDFFGNLEGRLLWTPFLLVITIASQALFIFSAGTVNLCRPIRKRRLVVPVIIASLMMTVLVASLSLSITELAYIDKKVDSHLLNYAFWIIIGLSWVIWGTVFFIKYKDKPRYKILRNLISTIITGSLIELLAAIPSHIIVSRRPGCFVGLATACGIIGGIAVMLWSFGPGIIFLFLREIYKAELNQNNK